jgi:hypothetical protein
MRCAIDNQCGAPCRRVYMEREKREEVRESERGGGGDLLALL